ncbi:MAG: twin-arginine translocase TatA/TatE family subunit [Actinobacteria bacterium]|jgi:TatA/E family protein of Tat protein translocase|nr:twin-arginine translocase TatA/TatE family subunit [Actinomycetota bacterium]
MLALFQSFGLPELGVILLIALIIFGPAQLPKIGRSVGKAIREFRASSQEVSKAIQEGIEGTDEEEGAKKKKSSDDED